MIKWEKALEVKPGMGYCHTCRLTGLPLRVFHGPYRGNALVHLCFCAVHAENLVDSWHECDCEELKRALE